ncbi:MAG: hypothetical protein AWU57_933 [Marinobacter sp. T13-3]|nr:MAG: hypothetical protein AWU57_933 [Marinobacter sp. T13-3]
MEMKFSVTLDGKISDGKNEYTASETAKLLNLYEHQEMKLLEVIHMIPECEEHGPDCLPHAKEWIEAHLSPPSRGKVE